MGSCEVGQTALGGRSQHSGVGGEEVITLEWGGAITLE